MLQQNHQGSDSLQKIISVSGKMTANYKGVGPFLSFFFMLFNGATTTLGAAKILPWAIGYPVGFFISIAYFILSATRDIKKEHPFRRTLLLIIFAGFSSMSSAFEIYSHLKPGDLEKQSAQPVLAYHSSLISHIRTSSDKAIDDARKQDVAVQKILDLEDKYKDSQVKRSSLGANEQQNHVAGNLAKDGEDLKEEAKQLKEKLTASQEAIYFNVNNLTKIRSSNDERLTVKDIVDVSSENLLSIGRNDIALFQEMKNANWKNDSEFKEPRLDSYVRIPNILIPAEIWVQDNNPKSKAIVSISLLFAIAIELIPLLLSGIQTGEESENKEKKATSKDIRRAERVYSAGTKKKRCDKTLIGQVAGAMSSVVSDTGKAIREVGSSVSSSLFSMTEGESQYLATSLDAAMNFAQLSLPLERSIFLIEFYNSIQYESKEIDLSHKLSQEIFADQFINDIFCINQHLEQRCVLASLLFVDLMHQGKWLKQLQNEKTKPNKSAIWKFRTGRYADFMTWLLNANQVYAPEAAQITSYLEIILDYSQLLAYIELCKQGLKP
jgi:hypothetical protein